MREWFDTKSPRLKLWPWQVRDLLLDQQAQSCWLGASSFFEPQRGGAALFTHHGGVVLSGTVRSVDADNISLDLAGPDGGLAELDISIKKDGAKFSEVSACFRTGDPPVPPGQERHWRDYWHTAFERLAHLCSQIARRTSPAEIRQAVIVVHGIGDQEPGATLRSLVEGVLGPTSMTEESARSRATESPLWWKPDRMSDLLELRRVTIQASGKCRPTTDIYELYWAHLLDESPVAAVGSWLSKLVFRWRVPRRFRLLWLSLWLVAGAVAGLGVAYLLGFRNETVLGIAGSSVLLAVLATIWRLVVRGFVTKSVGDAARYLTPRPSNIGNRQTIREAGVDLLDRLHQSGIYDRVVVVGHSLGSVIAYDVLSAYWIEQHKNHICLPRVYNKPIVDINKELTRTLARPEQSPGQKPIAPRKLEPREFQSLQMKAWLATRYNGQSWLVTDFVTIGSPLSMADYLLEDGADAIQVAIHERRLPSSPPVSEVDGSTGHHRVTFQTPYTTRFGDSDRSFETFHHAAMFAVTRWTNLYFPPKLRHDPIGGPVASWAGAWVRDVSLSPPQGKRWGLHSMYWRAAESTDHTSELGNAINLDLGLTLWEAVRKHSPLLYLEAAARDSIRIAKARRQ